MAQSHFDLPRFFAGLPILAKAAPILILAASAACYRATGYDRPDLIAQEIPLVGGDRVPGVKSMAGAGDYFLGNNFVAMTVDGSRLSERSGIAGAPGGGSIVDVGYIALDTSYRRINMPCDMLDRMTTVVNQDPDLSLVFYEFTAINDVGISRLAMHGQVHDPKHKLAGAAWDSHDFVQDVSASTTISLGPLGRAFVIETTITNNSPAPVGIRNIGDFVFQRGGGFRILATANEDKDGNPLSTWGVDIPGTDFSDPLANSALSGPVAFMGTEPGGNIMDCHVTLGLMPLDSKQFLVASDPQDSLRQTRPIFPERFVAGGMDTGEPLEPNEALEHKRMLFVKGGTSGAAEYYGMLTLSTPNQATGILNDMFIVWAALNDEKLGFLRFVLEGTASRSGPTPAELRFERYMKEDDGDPATDRDPANWRLERLEWMEPTETSEQYSDYVFTPSTTFGIYLPKGTYRIVAKNAYQSSVIQVGSNSNNEDRPSLEAPITIGEDLAFFLNERVSPERDDILSPYGSRTAYAQAIYYIGTRGANAPVMFVQPMRFTLAGTGGSEDPQQRRSRGLTSIYDPTAKLPRPTVEYSGYFHFFGGNSAFGVQLSNSIVLWTIPGIYQGYGARGPLSTLESFTVDSRPGLGAGYSTLTVFQAPMPEGWIAFDTPGPSMSTSGGMLPCEQLSSALAENVNVVARTEMDFHADNDLLYRDFRFELDYAEGYVEAINKDPLIVNARTSSLEDYGTVTAYFTPCDPEGRNGGARPSRGWTLADFLAQADGQYNVIHRPRGPGGIFTRLGFDPGLPLPGGAPWWGEAGPVSLGATNGGFDALEILNAGAIASSGIDAWWSEYRAVRGDWFALLSQQMPGSFTKALGFSSGKYSQDTPVGLARTYLNIGQSEISQAEQGPILEALKSGAAVASTGPLLDVSVEGAGPGGLAAIGGSPSAVAINITMLATDWMPIDEIRVIVNGQLAKTIANPKSDPAFARSEEDYRSYTATVLVNLPQGAQGKDAWLVVEAGAPLGFSGPYMPGTPWHIQMKGIYPAAITNPIFLNLTPGPYAPPGL